MKRLLLGGKGAGRADEVEQSFSEIFVQRMSLRTSDRCHWCGPFQGFPPVTIRTQSLPLRGGAPRSESKSNNCQWQLLHNVKVARASPASARRMRATCLSLWERCPVGAGRAIFTLSVTSGQLPQSGSQGRTDCDQGATPVCVQARNDMRLFRCRKSGRPMAVPYFLNYRCHGILNMACE